jgi:hypothetical protein
VGWAHRFVIQTLSPEAFPLLDASFTFRLCVLKEAYIDVYPPHEAFHHIWKVSERDGGESFRKSFLGASKMGDIESYWKARLLEPWAANHPLQKKPAQIPFAIPIFWHLDGARFANSGEAVCFSWASVYAKGCSWDSKHLSVVVDNEAMVKDTTNAEIVRFLNWSATSLLNGTFPEFMVWWLFTY